MPVIGRLDGQVDEIIISPISKRRQVEQRPPQQPEEETPAHTQIQTTDMDESSAKTDELPVWLL